MAARAPNENYVVEQLQEIIKFSTKQAKILLSQTNNDIMVAVEKFYTEETNSIGDDWSAKTTKEVGRDVNDNKGNERHFEMKNNTSSNKDKSVIRMKIENGIITTRPKLKKRFKENSFQDLNDEEEFLEEAIAVSIFESYPKFDLNYLRRLAMQYKGRHDELYKLLELQNYDEDHKIGKFSLLRRDLETYIVELRRAGEPVEEMVVEDCPNCFRPQIVMNLDNELSCKEGCKGVFCRDCRASHKPLSCLEFREGIVDEGKEQGPAVINSIKNRLVLDNFGSEYKMVEEEFLRLMTAMGKDFEVSGIEVIENNKLREKFQAKMTQFKFEGLNSVPVLLFHASNSHDVDVIAENNYNLSFVLSDYSHTIGVHFTECPDMDTLEEDKGCLVMSLVLEGYNMARVHDRSSVVVPDVDQILPKYIVHFTKRKNVENLIISRPKRRVVKQSSGAKEEKVTLDKPSKQVQVETNENCDPCFYLPVLQPRDCNGDIDTSQPH